MRVAIIAAELQENSRRRLKETVELRGHSPIMLIPEDLSASIDSTKTTLKLKDKAFNPDGIIHIMSTDFRSGLSILESLTVQIPYLNSARAVLVSADKFQTAAILAANNLPHLKVSLALNNDDLAIYAKHYQFPVVLKQPDGAKGKEVVLVEKPSELIKKADSIRSKGIPLLVQEYIEESRGEDIRIIIAGEKFIAGIKRKASDPYEFRANLSLGAKAESTDITNLEKDIAIKATKALGLDLAGVDILRSKRGPLITELNSFPGFKDTEECTGVDVAGTIVDLLIHKLN